MAKRNDVPITIRLDPELLHALDRWIVAQPVPPKRIEVIRVALKRLIGEGR